MTTLVKTNGRLAPSVPSLLNDFFSEDFFKFPLTQWRSEGTTLPAVNIRETPDAFEIDVAAPGMKRDDFKIELDNNVLSISSERQEQHEQGDNGDGYMRQEFSYQAFERNFNLPAKKVEEDKIEARYTDGILHISVPKKEEARKKPARQIKVE